MSQEQNQPPEPNAQEKEYLSVAEKGGDLFVNKLLISNAAGMVSCINLLTTLNQTSEIKLIAAKAFELFLFGFGAAILSAGVGHANSLFRALHPTKAFLKTIPQRIIFHGLDGLMGICLGGAVYMLSLALIAIYEFIKI